jgi:hypothetical protein
MQYSKRRPLEKLECERAHKINDRKPNGYEHEACDWTGRGASAWTILRSQTKPKHASSKLRRNGSMSQAPTLVEGSASPLGPALVESAKRALLLCQP